MTDDHRTHLAKAQERMKELRASGWKPEILSPVERAKRNPNSLKRAITAMCWLCEGGDADTGVRTRVQSCNLKDKCPLWPHRPWQHLGQGGQAGDDDGEEAGILETEGQPQIAA